MVVALAPVAAFSLSPCVWCCYLLPPLGAGACLLLLLGVAAFPSLLCVVVPFLLFLFVMKLNSRNVTEFKKLTSNRIKVESGQVRWLSPLLLLCVAAFRLSPCGWCLCPLTPLVWWCFHLPVGWHCSSLSSLEAALLFLLSVFRWCCSGASALYISFRFVSSIVFSCLFFFVSFFF